MYVHTYFIVFHYTAVPKHVLRKMLIVPFDSLLAGLGSRSDVGMWAMKYDEIRVYVHVL